jgi:hypothetical protein
MTLWRGGTRNFHDRLHRPKALIRFLHLPRRSHCEIGNRSLLNRWVLDWLDDMLRH